MKYSPHETRDCLKTEDFLGKTDYIMHLGNIIYIIHFCEVWGNLAKIIDAIEDEHRTSYCTEKQKGYQRLTRHTNMSYKRAVQALWMGYFALQDLMFIFCISTFSPVPSMYCLLGIGIWELRKGKGKFDQNNGMESRKALKINILA